MHEIKAANYSRSTRILNDQGFNGIAFVCIWLLSHGAYRKMSRKLAHVQGKTQVHLYAIYVCM